MQKPHRMRPRRLGYANVYVPRLQYAAGVAYFFRGHRGATFASTVLGDPISKGFVAAIHRFAESRGVPVIRFAKGQRKMTSPCRETKGVDTMRRTGAISELLRSEGRGIRGV